MRVHSSRSRTQDFVSCLAKTSKTDRLSKVDVLQNRAAHSQRRKSLVNDPAAILKLDVLGRPAFLGAYGQHPKATVSDQNAKGNALQNLTTRAR